MPVPALVTVRVKICGLNVAVQVLFAFTVTVPSVQSGSPLQPAKTEPVVAVAVRVTTAPSLKGAEQMAPQLIPVGLDVTVPVPVPALVTVRV